MMITITGTDGDDILSIGTEGVLEDFVVYSRGGKNQITFNGIGTDLIYSWSDGDTIWAGAGNDYIKSGSDNTIGYGGAGDDSFEGSGQFYGGLGDDYMNGYYRDNTLFGGAGNDRIFGRAGNDTLYGGSGDDDIRGGGDNDWIYGGAGDDILYGNKGYSSDDDGLDRIWGGAGNDRIYASAMVTSPWSIEIDGMVDNPGTFSVAELTEGLTEEERIYRFRCVEAWSMVVPWNGFELADILAKAGVQSGASYVSFETAVLPDVMPGVRRRVLDFPYREGLRLDEALHPLTMMATGIYGEPIPNQNGAPIRLVVPWKYGFKSIKSIVRITLTDEQPDTSWNMSNAREYGFYSNVNPEVDHPRWSQGSERKIGGGLFAKRQDTLMFNGYETEVASLYAGMDLHANF